MSVDTFFIRGAPPNTARARYRCAVCCVVALCTSAEAADPPGASLALTSVLFCALSCAVPWCSYGVSYCEAAGSVWELLKARGFDMLINDSLIGIALGFACLMGGLSSAAVCGVMSHVLFTSSGVWWVWALIGFVMGFAMTMVATEVVDSAVTALFVCLADDPAALQRTKPDEYAKLVPAIQARYPAISFVAF